MASGDVHVTSGPPWAVSPRGYLALKLANAWHQCCPGRSQLAPQAPATAPHPQGSARPVLQVCLAGSQQTPAPNSLTGRKDVNRGQGAGGGQRQRATPGELASAGKCPPRCGTQCWELPRYPARVPRGSLPAIASTPGEVLPASAGQDTASQGWCSLIGQSVPRGRSELRRRFRFRFPFGGQERVWRPEG